MMKKKIGYTLLRMMAGIMMFFVVTLLCAFAIFATVKMRGQKQEYVRNGMVAFTSGELTNSPVYLNGTWDLFDGVVCEGEEQVSQLGQKGTSVVMPIGSVTMAQKDATYRVYLQLPAKRPESLYLAVPTYRGDDLYVFVNGVKQKGIVNEGQWVSRHALTSMYKLTGFSEGSGLQELVVSGNFSQDISTLYRRPVLLGTMENITTMVTLDSSAQMLVLGMFLLTLVSGYVFMLFRPGHMLISMITLFDTMLMFRIIPTMNYVFSFCEGIFPAMSIPDQTLVSFSFFFLMLGGFVGCQLSARLFDPENTVSKWLTVPPAVSYLVLALVFSWNEELFERMGIPILIVVYLYTFVGVFVQFIHCWKRTKRRKYYLFQFVKTCYVGGLIFFDILLWLNYTDSNIWYYFYSIFFLMHIIVRLYDNNRSYQSVENMNRDLERTVSERTKELLRANQVLSELSIRDHLTHAFNRLYFEQLMERLISENKIFYLCLFDLDLFKKINDTFGHAAGDELLCRITAIVQKVVGQDAVFARIGGEEFVLLYEGMSFDQVLASVGALHRAVEENARISERYTTASFGLAKRCEGDTEKNILKRADAALYQAKSQGRNRIVLHEDLVQENLSTGTKGDENDHDE